MSVDGGRASPDVLRLLERGELRIEGRLIDASNATLYCRVRLGDENAHVVYKPIAGERPLWDFPDGTLAAREVAAYLVSEALGWAIVPPTLLRAGPLGDGMLQLWVDVDETVDVTRLVRGRDVQLRRMALFDAVVNNADRKGGHLLPTSTGHIFGIDHGVCFHRDDKLRTVLWQWRGRPLQAEEADCVDRVAQGPGRRARRAPRDLLSGARRRRPGGRVERLLSTNRFPAALRGLAVDPVAAVLTRRSDPAGAG